jgi:hypothetical protein
VAGKTVVIRLSADAVSIALREGSENLCRPGYGHLLFALASAAEVIGETRTGCGVGLADLVATRRWPAW